MTVSGSWRRAARGAGLLGADGAVAPTIFAEMSALAVRTGAINLGQGFPDEDGPRPVLDAAIDAIRAGRNQYPPGIGVPELRQAIAEHQHRFYGLDVDPDREVLVTAGATEAIAATLLALLEPGDEVVTFEPYLRRVRRAHRPRGRRAPHRAAAAARLPARPGRAPCRR